ncbi:NAD(P)/FAD-dependent oxidoreductase [Rathayibacter soli]|uniref:NAD(P)/FAD-dependent oxidoreductase n=1 Tax=Rathayibacter soli TaxID=3144168 RepID=UPI0027E46B9B|nr:FAD-dependent oxidoreductase [Glaciibacter superstes]
MQHRVIVVGGGYAGVIAANRLASGAAEGVINVVLINPRDVFVERIRLHEFAAGSRADVVRPLSALLSPRVDLVIDSVVEMQPGHHVVVLAGGRTLSYDSLVYAPGSGAGGAPHGARIVGTVECATLLRNRLDVLPSGGRIAVVGGGLTGIETASELAEQRTNLSISLYTAGMIAPAIDPRSRARLRTGLRRVGVSIREHVTVSPAPDLAGELGVDEVVWCAGFTSPTLARDSGLRVDRRDRLILKHTLQSVEYPNIYGAGDACAIDGARYEFHRPSCASAMPMGGQAADNILAALGGRALRAHSQGYVAQCISIGRKDALIQFVHRDDTPVPWHIAGRSGAQFKEAVSRLTIRWLRREGRRYHAYTWASAPAPATPEPEKANVRG